MNWFFLVICWTILASLALPTLLLAIYWWQGELAYEYEERVKG